MHCIYIHREMRAARVQQARIMQISPTHFALGPCIILEHQESTPSATAGLIRDARAIGTWYLAVQCEVCLAVCFLITCGLPWGAETHAPQYFIDKAAERTAASSAQASAYVVLVKPEIKPNIEWFHIRMNSNLASVQNFYCFSWIKMRFIYKIVSSPS